MVLFISASVIGPVVPRRLKDHARYRLQKENVQDKPSVLATRLELLGHKQARSGRQRAQHYTLLHGLGVFLVWAGSSRWRIFQTVTVLFAALVIQSSSSECPFVLV